MFHIAVIKSTNKKHQPFSHVLSYLPKNLYKFNIYTMVMFAVDFDKLGLTDNENPYGDFPPILARSMGRAAVSMATDYIGQYLERRRGKRSDDQHVSEDIEKTVLEKLHGGER